MGLGSPVRVHGSIGIRTPPNGRSGLDAPDHWPSAAVDGEQDQEVGIRLSGGTVTPEDDARRVLEHAKREERLAFDLLTWAKPYVTATQLAGYLDVDRRTVIRMIRTAALPAVKAGRCWRIPTSAARDTFHVAR